MLNFDFRITPKSSRRAELHWLAPSADHVSWVFVDGRHIQGPMFFGTIDRTLDIPFKTDDVIKIEIHDILDFEEPMDPVFERPNTRPIIRWVSIPTAVRYKIYHKEGTGPEKVIHDEPGLEGVERNEVKSPISLEGRGGVWHFFRVEAVDQFGNESTRLLWRLFVTDVPATVDAVSVTVGSGAGLYDITLS